jgi:alpha-mannosidase
VYKVLLAPDLSPDLKDALQAQLEQALAEVYPESQPGEAFHRALQAAQQRIHAAVYQPGQALDGRMSLVGHSHLDLVYMWPYREFQRKVGRTHATMLRLMEQYPEFHFSQSQACLYQEMKTHYPDLFAQVKERVAEGRWEPLGAFWVEPDCNLISGESFVRQILHGQQFWQSEFGLRSRICWQPDVFGMSAAMPQILRRSGIEYAMTNKMFVWNDTNPWRQNTFWWEGLDGSRVLTVVPPGHFIGMVDPDHVLAQWNDYSDKATIGDSLYCFGWGDGGGGVDVEMLELAQRYADFPGLPQLAPGLATDYFERVQAKAAAATLPVWRDDLYLETHRGTFTTKGRLKKLNRRAEFLYRQAELLASWAWLETGKYPDQDLKAGWQKLLTSQFHDSLPGTHVREAYLELLAEFEQIFAIGQQVTRAAFADLQSASEAAGPALHLFNPFGHARAGVERLPLALAEGEALLDAAGAVVLTQAVRDLDSTPATLAELPAIGPTAFRSFQVRPAASGAEQTSLRVGADWLENEYLRVQFNPQGELISLLDKRAGRQVITPGQRGNRFQMYEDIPGKYDAWDIVANYQQRELPLPDTASLLVDERGPLRAALRLERAFGTSKLVQRISLRRGDPLLYFETFVHWQERQKLLKVGFPLDVHALHATFDIAFGSQQRPTHRNTSYEAARFEVPAHLWADLAESGYGVALLNDCKYGHEVVESLLRLTLLKGSISPDPTADMEDHTFTYALYPHSGDWREAQVMQRALNLNEPLTCFEGGGTLPAQSFVQLDAANVTLETVKRAEDGDGLIVRLVERHNRRAATTLTFDRPVRTASLCNLMEENEFALTPQHAQVRVPFKPCEIVTLKVSF